MLSKIEREKNSTIIIWTQKQVQRVCYLLETQSKWFQKYQPLYKRFEFFFIIFFVVFFSFVKSPTIKIETHSNLSHGTTCVIVGSNQKVQTSYRAYLWTTHFMIWSKPNDIFFPAAVCIQNFATNSPKKNSNTIYGIIIGLYLVSNQHQEKIFTKQIT